MCVCVCVCVRVCVCVCLNMGMCVCLGVCCCGAGGKNRVEKAEDKFSCTNVEFKVTERYFFFFIYF